MPCDTVNDSCRPGGIGDLTPNVIAGLPARPSTSTRLPEGSSLTAAELHLLPLLPTHLNYVELAERLYRSRHTVKTQAVSIYRKLGVSSRSQAVQHAQQLGLGG